MQKIPDPNAVFPNEYGTTCFLKNVITAPNIFVGDYTYYDDPVDPAGFEKNNVLFNWPEFGDRLIIGKFCQLASGVRFVMGSANHRLGRPAPTRSTCSAAPGPKTRRPTCPSCPSRVTQWWATMCGSGGTASSCRGCTSATAPLWPASRW